MGCVHIYIYIYIYTPRRDLGPGTRNITESGIWYLCVTIRPDPCAPCHYTNIPKYHNTYTTPLDQNTKIPIPKYPDTRIPKYLYQNAQIPKYHNTKIPIPKCPNAKIPKYQIYHCNNLPLYKYVGIWVFWYWHFGILVFWYRYFGMLIFWYRYFRILV